MVEAPSGLFLLLAWAGLNALIAFKRGRSGWGWFALSVLPAVPLVVVGAAASDGNGTVAGFAAFLAPLAGFIAAIAVKSGAEEAAASGAHGDFVRCPFCAEPIRRHAVKCRHCASDLPASAAAS